MRTQKIKKNFYIVTLPAINLSTRIDEFLEVNARQLAQVGLQATFLDAGEDYRKHRSTVNVFLSSMRMGQDSPLAKSTTELFTRLDKQAASGANLFMPVPEGFLLNRGLDVQFLRSMLEQYQHLANYTLKVIWLTTPPGQTAEEIIRRSGMYTIIRNQWLEGGQQLAADVMVDFAESVGKGNFKLIAVPDENNFEISSLLEAFSLKNTPTSWFFPSKNFCFPSPLCGVLFHKLTYEYLLAYPAILPDTEWRVCCRDIFLKTPSLPPYTGTLLSPDDLKAIHDRNAPAIKRASQILLQCDDMFTGTVPLGVDEQSWQPQPLEPEGCHWREMGGLFAESEENQGRKEEAYRKLSFIAPVLSPGMKIVAEACAKKWNKPWPPVQEAKVSVLTLTYNHEKYIEQNIKSVLAQETDFPVQHIILDNNSTDRTRDIISEYADKHPSIRPFFWNWTSAERGNCVKFLFSLCKTEFAAMCDGDDFFCNPSKLQRQVDFLEANPKCSICFHPVYMLWENGEKPNTLFPQDEDLPPHKPPYRLVDLIRWNFMSTSSVMYRWRFRDELPEWFYQDALPGDWYWHILHAEQGHIGYIPEVMSLYRRHVGGLWAKAETDLVAHKKRNSLKELRTMIKIDEHFAGRYRNLLQESIFWEFNMLFSLAEEGSPELFDTAVSEFPEWARHVSQMAAAGYGQD